jgi:16S rRNA (guanine966-N2)-methyltransferase
MKILGGYLKNREVLADFSRVRPTSSKVKEAIFHIIGDISSFKVLDLFSGTGALSFESISRGADSVVSVELDGKHFGNIKKNIDIFNISESINVFRNRAEVAIKILKKQGYVFDLIFIDPPYGYSNYLDLIKQILDLNLLNVLGNIVIEISKRSSDIHDHFKKYVDSKVLKDILIKNYGDTSLIVLTK